ncbi:MAG: hypothetical protein AAFS10_19665 [Myxococcota bacterium]
MTNFKAFRSFNDPTLARLTGLRARLEPRMLDHFPVDGLPDRVAHALASHTHPRSCLIWGLNIALGHHEQQCCS